jgi:predicted membrane-bound spermidine synthase
MRYLSLLVFTAGAVTLGVELSAARLLDPWFGNSQVVWAALIGLILLYLALGAWLGGKLADRHPTLTGLLLVATVAGLGVALIPTVSPPILRFAALGLEGFIPGLLAGSLLAVLIIFSLPVILLGAISPWAVRLAVNNLEHTGETAGRLYAIATAGSILGTFLPVLWLIPAYGTRLTFYILAGWLLVVVTAGTLLSRQARHFSWAPVVVLIAIIILSLRTDPTAVRVGWDDGAFGEIIYEDESLYNYISVRQWGTERHLKLNEGVGIHSVYHPDTVLSQGIWDYFLLAPLFRPTTREPVAGGPRNGRTFSSPDAPTQRTDARELCCRQVLLIGLAAGTVSELYTDVYGPVPITGVELDPQIIDVGRRYFELDRPNLTSIAADGRRWLQSQAPDRMFDVVLVDAYRPPYIPFHLTTVEFFDLVRSHLTPDGVIAINVGRTHDNFALVDALSKTLNQVFPSVLVVDEPGPEDDLGNSIVVATVQPTTPETFRANAAALPQDLPQSFLSFVERVAPSVRTPHPSAETPIFTDDRAPVEQVVHRIIWDFVSR